jgi:hypothetical protein
MISFVSGVWVQEATTWFLAFRRLHLLHRAMECIVLAGAPPCWAGSSGKRPDGVAYEPLNRVEDFSVRQRHKNSNNKAVILQVGGVSSKHGKDLPMLNPVTPELNPSAKRCLTRFFYWGFYFFEP